MCAHRGAATPRERQTFVAENFICILYINTPGQKLREISRTVYILLCVCTRMSYKIYNKFLINCMYIQFVIYPRGNNILGHLETMVKMYTHNVHT